MEDNPHPHAALIARAAELAKTTQDVAGRFGFRKSQENAMHYIALNTYFTSKLN